MEPLKKGVADTISMAMDLPEYQEAQETESEDMDRSDVREHF